MSFDPFPKEIHQEIVDFADSPGAPGFALATILRDTGSTPRKAGTKAIIDAAGKIHGTIGGGAVEAEAQRLSVEAIRTQRPVVFDFALSGSSASDTQPICGGSMRILIDPMASAHRDTYARAAEAHLHRNRGVLLTTVRSSAVPQITVQWLAEDAIPSDPHGLPASDIRAAIAAEAPQLFVAAEPDAVEVLIEPLTPPPLLVIAGGGHVGQALALHATLVGFQIMVIDDRADFADPSLYPPGVITHCDDIARHLAALPMADNTYIAILTRGHQHDARAMAACIRTPAAYIGMIGSRRKVAMIRQDLIDSGAATPTELDRVYAPIGLDIGAQTVAEIAASIVAQLIAVRRNGTAHRSS